MILFLNIMAGILLVFSLLKICVTIFAKRSILEEEVIRQAEALGMNPVGDALVKPFFTFIVSVAWIMAQIFS